MSRTLIVTTPLSIGDLVGRSFRLLRQHLPLVAKTLILPTILLAVGRISLLVGITYSVKFFTNPMQGLAWFSLIFFGVIVLFAALINFWIRQMSLIRLMLGYSTNYAEARAALKDRIYSLIGLSIITAMSMGMGVLMWGILAGFSVPFLKMQGMAPILSSLGLATAIVGGLATIIGVSTVSQLAMTALALEKGELGAIIGKAFSLTMHAFMRSLLFLIVTMLTIMLVSYPLALPTTVLAFGWVMLKGTMTGSTPADVPIWIQIFNALWESVINMVVSPLYYLAYGLFYTDLCMRQEGLDLIERLDRVESSEMGARRPGNPFGDDAQRLSSSGY